MHFVLGRSSRRRATHGRRARQHYEVVRRAANRKYMYFYTYVLKSKKDNKLYIGSSGDIKTRLKAHNAGEVESTKSRRPLELIYFEACTSKRKSEDRELYFKTGFGRKFLKNRI